MPRKAAPRQRAKQQRKSSEARFKMLFQTDCVALQQDAEWAWELVKTVVPEQLIQKPDLRPTMLVVYILYSRRWKLAEIGQALAITDSAVSRAAQAIAKAVLVRKNPKDPEHHRRNAEEFQAWKKKVDVAVQRLNRRKLPSVIVPPTSVPTTSEPSAESTGHTTPSR